MNTKRSFTKLESGVLSSKGLQPHAAEQRPTDFIYTGSSGGVFTNKQDFYFLQNVFNNFRVLSKNSIPVQLINLSISLTVMSSFSVWLSLLVFAYVSCQRF